MQTTTDVKLCFGMRDGHVVHISQLTAQEKGLRCNCTCPQCGTPLQAKMGTKRAHHFAHHGDYSCDIFTANQTALHLMAKDIIESDKQLGLPAITVTPYDLAFSLDALYGYDTLIPPQLEYQPAKTVLCDKVILERRFSDFVPDITIHADGTTYFVEIAVTHFVDDEKLEKVTSAGIPMLEIDLSSLHLFEDLTREKMKSILISSTSRRWILPPDKEAAYEWAKAEYLRLMKETESKRNELIEVEEHWQEINDSLKGYPRQRAIAQQKLNKLFVPETYRSTVLSLRNDSAAKSALENCSFMQKAPSQYPFFLDIPIMGEFVFLCDRRIWQSMLFDSFVYNPVQSEEPICSRAVIAWLRQHRAEIPVDWEITYEANVHLSPQRSYKTYLLHDVIDKYLFYLSYLGFISLEPGYSVYVKDNATYLIKETHTLIPPYSKKAHYLHEAISSSNALTPTVSVDIQNSLREIAYVATLTSSEKQAYKRMSTSPEKQHEVGAEFAAQADFDSPEPIKDEYGYRWLLCTQCGRKLRENQMSFYGGKGSENKGVCRDCSRNPKAKD